MSMKIKIWHSSPLPHASRSCEECESCQSLPWGTWSPCACQQSIPEGLLMGTLSRTVQSLPALAGDLGAWSRPIFEK